MGFGAIKVVLGKSFRGLPGQVVPSDPGEERRNPRLVGVDSLFQFHGASGRKMAPLGLVGFRREGQLSQVVLATELARSFTDLLYPAQEQSDQNGDDCQNYQKFDQGKSGPVGGLRP